MAEDNMKLPEGYTCKDCIAHRTCMGLFGCPGDNVECDWSPSRFRRSEQLQLQDLLLAVVQQHCTFGGKLDSMNIEVNAKAILVLVSSGFVELERCDGNRVIGKVLKIRRS